MYTARRTIVGGVSLAAAFVFATGCALFGGGTSAVHLQSGGQDPAAQGTVKTKITNDGNTAVTVDVKHLAPPNRIAPGASTYVVWVHPLGVPATRGSGERADDTAYNLGGLKVDSDLNGDLSTTTPFHSFELFITAESSAAVTKPTSDRALWATVSRE